jgi:SnoaL-like domain
MTESALEELVAKQAITEVLYRYCRGIDRRDWELLRSCYHPDAHDDHAIYRGERDGLIEFMGEFVTAHCSATKHTVNNILITVTGDTATAESQIHAWHRMLPEPGAEDAPPKELSVSARNVDHLERRSGEWRFASRVLVFDWVRSVVARGSRAPWNGLHLLARPCAVADPLVVQRWRRAGERNDNRTLEGVSDG